MLPYYQVQELKPTGLKQALPFSVFTSPATSFLLHPAFQMQLQSPQHLSNQFQLISTVLESLPLCFTCLG